MRSRNPLSAIISFPKEVEFETQDEQEEIILLLRRHPVTNIGWILLSILMIIAPVVLKYVPFLASFPQRFCTIIVIVWYLITLSFIFEKFISWFYNVYIITDERIIDVDFHSLVYREISQCKIDKIQDITYKGGGLFRSIFNFGDIFIQTAAETQLIEFEKVPDPAKIVRVLNHLIIQEEQEKIDGRVR
jgi:uncharacterized membrane protein YdbT with pleckstrin-like domain